MTSSSRPSRSWRRRCWPGPSRPGCRSPGSPLTRSTGRRKYLRAWLEERDVSYVLAIKRSDTLTTRERRAARRCADRGAARPGPGSGCRQAPGRTARGSTTGPGSRSAPAPGGPAAGTGCWPAAPCNDPGEIAYYACYGPRRSRLVDLAWIAGSRWHIEECFQQAKNEAGLDHYQVRSWRAWHAHITLSMLALAWLAASRAQAVKGEPAPATRA